MPHTLDGDKIPRNDKGELVLTELRYRDESGNLGDKIPPNNNIPKEFNFLIIGDSTSTKLEEQMIRTETDIQYLTGEYPHYGGIKSTGNGLRSQRLNRMTTIAAAFAADPANKNATRENCTILKAVLDWVDIIGADRNSKNKDNVVNMKHYIKLILNDAANIILNFHRMNKKTVFVVSLVQPIMSDDTWLDMTKNNPGFTGFCHCMELECFLYWKKFNRDTGINVEVIWLTKAITETAERIAKCYKQRKGKDCTWSSPYKALINGIHLTVNGQKILCNEIYRSALQAWSNPNSHVYQGNE